MRKLLPFILLLLLLSCEQVKRKSDTEWKTIEIGDYLFDFPSNFELMKERGVDSYIGKIKGDSMLFSFDFGYYSSSIEQTPQEYLDKGYWRLDLPYQFMKPGITYDQTNTPKVDILTIRQATVKDSTLRKGCDYVARCKHNNTEFDFAISLPNEIKQSHFIIDTIDNQYRKIVLAKDTQKGITGVYIMDVSSFSKYFGNYLALSMVTNKLTIQQQEIALSIFKTARHKK